MKKFEFTLDRLKDYREQILEAEKNTLGVLRGQMHELEMLETQIRDTIEMKNEELWQTMQSGTTPIEIAMMKRFIIAKQQELSETGILIQRKNREIEKQLEVVIAATQDLSSMEKLEEKQLEAYQAEEMKEHERFVEEFVMGQELRKKRSLKQSA
ncbi:hypothetical protein FACS189499_01610 [Clostridia bacterium]|nr:hypothetical protein FACS189499_01610 [Clostridia bacterium]